jgi:deoxyribodipyrimidine photo-lyase
MRYDKPGAQFKAWCEGKTGYPFVDAAMRQLIVEGWMHNRTRMVVASFLVKDLHLEWQLGERFFAEHLVDYDVASNAHGWQWTAGCGTDASPYYRVFNPIEQGKQYAANPLGPYGVFGSSRPSGRQGYQPVDRRYEPIQACSGGRSG